jgi:hypothetical protein
VVLIEGIVACQRDTWISIAGLDHQTPEPGQRLHLVERQGFDAVPHAAHELAIPLVEVPKVRLVGPQFVPGMSAKEPLCALGVVAVWGIYGWVYLMRQSKAKGKEILLKEKTVA